MKKFIKTGSIFRRRGKNGKISITIPRIDIPHILFGDPEDGVGRGKGKPGDVVGRDPQPGKGGDDAGNDHGEGIEINVEVDEILKELEDELKLPDLKPKPNQTLKEERIKYNDIALVGPESLRHNRRTFQQALKRCSASGSTDMVYRPGFVDPIPSISIINSDKRYRQYKVIEEPSSNAVIFFARDWSGSMDQYKCDIVSDMSWWIELFISRHYKRVERVYVGHDTVAEECDSKKFYNYRYGGGTNCSSAFQFIAKQFENRFPANQWNVYVLYFTDGDNWNDDNENLVKSLKTDFTPQVANLVALTQVMSWRYENSVKARIDKEIKSGGLNREIIKTTQIAADNSANTANPYGWGGGGQLTDEDRDAQIKRAIGEILGSQAKKADAA